MQRPEFFLFQNRSGGLLSLLLLGLLACGPSGDGGVQPGSASYDPAPGDYSVNAFEPFQIKAYDAQGVENSFRLFADGSLLAEGMGLSYLPIRGGQAILRAEADLSGGLLEGVWNLAVSTVSADSLPPVGSLTVDPGPSPGQLLVRWQSPPPASLSAELEGYFIGTSDGSLPPEAFDPDNAIFVPHNAAGLQQEYLLDQLGEGQVLFLRVAARDAEGRLSRPSREVEQRATGSFELRGRVWGIRPNTAGREPLDGAILDLAGRRTLSDDQGNFTMLGLPDLRPEPLLVRDSSGGAFYTLLTDSLATEDAVLELYLIERFELELVSGEGPISALDYLEYMTSNEFPPRLLHTWPSWPVKVQLIDFTSEPGVNYRTAIETAISRWNLAAGIELLVGVESAPPEGVWITADLTVGDPNLGITRLIQPTGERIWEASPLRMRIDLRNNLINAELASRLIAHELGHAIGLRHSPNGSVQLMESTLPSESGGMPDQYEAWVAKVLRYLPDRLDLTGYRSP